MQIVINISEKDYKDFKSQTITVGDLLNDIMSGTAILAIKNGTPLENHDEEVIKETVESIWGKPPYTEMLDKIRAEIAEYKDDKIIHAERNEMIDIVLEIIDKHMRGTENE